MGPKRIKRLRMRRLSNEEIGAFRLTVMSMLHSSPDPFGSVMYFIDVGQCQHLIKDMTERTGIRISLNHVLNKMLALAIAENPVFNQLVLGRRLYQMEGIHIANSFLVPGPEEILTHVVLENPHMKPLEEIRQELKGLLTERARELSTPQSKRALLMVRIFCRLNLIRFVGERRVFTGAFERGLVSNILLVNHTYKTQTTYIVLTHVVGKTPLRIHAHPPFQQVVLENDRPVAREVVSLKVTIDHRIMHGLHVQRFGESLQRIASAPEKYLL